nr:MAG TPA: hypothetical protein [Caudoviricetes sp.]
MEHLFFLSKNIISYPLHKINGLWYNNYRKQDGKGVIS